MSTVQIYVDLSSSFRENSEDFLPDFEEHSTLTAAQVVNEMKATSSKRRALDDFGLLDFDDLTISVMVVDDMGNRTTAEW